MADTGISKKDTSLLAGPDSSGSLRAGEAAPVISQVQKEFGVHPLRQMRDIITGRMSARRIGSNEYYNLRLFNPELSPAEKAGFLGQGATNAMNAGMNPLELVPAAYFIKNKLLYSALLSKLEIPTTATQAVFSKSIYAGNLPTLRSRAELEAFLQDPSRYPLFGKPFNGSLSVGSVRIESLEDGHLKLSNGRRLKIEDFAKEVAEKYPNGFLLQSALMPHPEVAAIAGLATACVRVVSVNDGSAIRPVYAVWKLPAPNAMSDNFWQKGSLIASLDLESGTVRACRRGTGMATEWLTHHPETQAEIVGKTLPMWPETLELARNAHLVFPEFGVCGFDIALTPEGPVIVECNDNPAHMLYQLASQTGIRSDELAPVWDKVAARQRARLEQHKAARKKSAKKRGVRA